MTYQIIAHHGVQREIKKLLKKDKVLYEHIKKRLKILAEQPEIGKPLRNVMKPTFSRFPINHNHF